MTALSRSSASFLAPRGNDASPLPGVIGNGPAMREVFQLTRLAASGTPTVLIVGETGTGKELVARALYELSPRAGGPYIRVNCGALHENLLESELFGHVKGSFTGAIENRIGRFEAAHQGTMFLDEVNSMSPSLQVKLLRVLQEGQFERVGDHKTIRVDVRIIAAANEPLETPVAAGRFREDLYYRLNVLPIFLPPLRARTEDIEPLARMFLSRYARANDLPEPELTADLLRALQEYDWPGNVRELENAIERLVVLSRGVAPSADMLRPCRPRFPFRTRPDVARDDLPTLARRAARVAVAETGESGNLYDQYMQMFEKELLTHVLSICDGVQTKAARLLGINRNTLAKKLGTTGEDKEPEWVI